VDWISELLILLFGPGETWGEMARGLGLIGVIIGMLFLAHRWLSRGLQKK